MNLLNAIVDTTTVMPAMSVSGVQEPSTQNLWASVRAAVWSAVFAGVYALLQSLLTFFLGSNLSVVLYGATVPLSLVAVFVLRLAIQALNTKQG